MEIPGGENDPSSGSCRNCFLQLQQTSKFIQSNMSTQKSHNYYRTSVCSASRKNNSGLSLSQRLTRLVLILLNLLATTGHANPDAKRLYDDLMSNYNRLIRPVSNHTEQITVKLGVRLSQLVELERSLLQCTRTHYLGVSNEYTYLIFLVITFSFGRSVLG